MRDHRVIVDLLGTNESNTRLTNCGFNLQGTRKFSSNFGDSKTSFIKNHTLLRTSVHDLLSMSTYSSFQYILKSLKITIKATIKATILKNSKFPNKTPNVCKKE